MNKRKILITLGLLLILITICLAFVKYRNILPHDFTIKLGGINASAAGTRSFVWEFNFSKDTLIHATENYNMATESTTTKGQCILLSQKWVESENQENPCPFDWSAAFKIPTTRKEFQQKIQSGEFVKGDPEKCEVNRAVCYSISLDNDTPKR